VGEFATMTGSPTGNMSAALGDAAWMAGMERNSDIVVMSSYAPLFVNVNKGGMQWRTNLIGYDALTSYGSPTYYALKMFSLNHGDVVVPVVAQDVPTREWQPPAGRSAFGAPTAAELQAPPPARQVPTLHYSVTRDSKAGTIYVKIVNRAGTPQPVRLALSGVISVEANGRLVTMSAGSPTDTNSITEPTSIVPVTTNVNGLSKDFTRNFPPYSVSVLVINAR
jgi:alpha-N-arabinofuranosidase